MSGAKFAVLFFVMAAALAVTAPCRADLFAAIPLDNEILRIDTATGNVTDTIAIPDWITSSQPTSIGLAYDGRQFLTLNVRRGDYDELWQFDVAFGGWFPGSILTVPDHPADMSSAITGMGMLPGDFGFNTLVAVTQHNPAYPSFIVKFEMPLFPGPPDILAINGPSVPLPADFAALSADIDPDTGELWIGGDEIGDVNTPRLLRVDMTTGEILQTLTPSGSASPIRGIGFDGGAMFVGVRDLPALANDIYEVDRTTGAVLRTITLPADKLIGGLAGGPVIPEPGAGLIAALLGANLTIVMRWRASVV